MLSKEYLSTARQLFVRGRNIIPPHEWLEFKGFLLGKFPHTH